MADIGSTLSPAAPLFPVALKPRRSFDLPRNALFASLSRAQQRLVLPHVKFRRYKAGKVFLDEGARNPGKLFIIVEGQVAVLKDAVAPLENRVMRYEMALLRRGDLCGDVSFMDAQPSRVTFMAKTDIALAVLDLSAAGRNKVVRRVKQVVVAKLKRTLIEKAGQAIQFQVNTLQIENELARFRTGVGHLVVTTLCLLSFYTIMLSVLPSFNSIAHANFALSPLIILLFSLSFVPVIATSGFPLPFFGLRIDNWQPALLFSLKVSGVFLAAFLALKALLIAVVPAFHGLALVGWADVEVAGGRQMSLSAWYWLALFVYVLLTPMQEFVARSGIQAPLYAFLNGSEAKRRWFAIVASNLVFAAAHAHISVAFALAAFLPGLLWGWIFARTNSLLASTASHLLVGGITIFLFGVEGLVSRLAG
jgi:membrane protease YdiL (CAAX protease family)/CRP-like cAMP-binding protein